MCQRKQFHKNLCISVLYEKTSEEESELKKPCHKPSATFQNKKCVWLPLKTWKKSQIYVVLQASNSSRGDYIHLI